MHDPFDDDPAELTSTPPAAPRKAEREGLPAGYRMRADAHYVDQLTSRRSERHQAESRPAAVVEAESADAEPSDRERLRTQIHARLAEGLGTIASSSALLAGDASPLARRTNIDVIRAEAWRAGWMVAALRVLDGGTRHQARSRQLGPVLERIRQGFAPECRLGGAQLHILATDWSASVAIDEPALVTGINGAIVATFGLLGQIEGATIKVTADAMAGDLRMIEVAQEDVSVPSVASLRFFEPAWADRPGGWMAGVGATVAKAVAQQHGGNAVLLAGDRRGTVVRMTMTRGL